jgi:hypothetical protein
VSDEFGKIMKEVVVAFAIRIPRFETEDIINIVLLKFNPVQLIRQEGAKCNGLTCKFRVCWLRWSVRTLADIPTILT